MPAGPRRRHGGSGQYRGAASLLLLKAAKWLKPLDLDLARETYSSAWTETMLAGCLLPARPNGGDWQFVEGYSGRPVEVQADDC